MNFATDDEPPRAKLLVISYKTTACVYGSCAYLDTVAFPVSAEIMEEVAGKYVAGASPL